MSGFIFKLYLTFRFDFCIVGTLSVVRSLNGCWICRLRHKKCDESLPWCENCLSLGLKCAGYGPRPEWMDGGTLERGN